MNDLEQSIVLDFNVKLVNIKQKLSHRMVIIVAVNIKNNRKWVFLIYRGNIIKTLLIFNKGIQRYKTFEYYRFR